MTEGRNDDGTMAEWGCRMGETNSEGERLVCQTAMQRNIRFNEIL